MGDFEEMWAPYSCVCVRAACGEGVGAAWELLMALRKVWVALKGVETRQRRQPH